MLIMKCLIFVKSAFSALMIRTCFSKILRFYKVLPVVSTVAPEPDLSLQEGVTIPSC